ncbi:MAG: LolA family protein [Burkholderiaceae bacterium]
MTLTFSLPHRFLTVLTCVGMASLLASPITTVAANDPVVSVRAGAEAVTATDQLRAFITNTASASGRFVQSGASLGPDEASRGEFAFARPGKFRWAVTDPYPQLLVADGQDVYFHDVDLNQVTVRPMSGALGATPAAILFGTGNIDDRFEMADDGEEGGLYWLVAVPREKEAGFERIRIGFANSLPAAMEVLDAFNNTSRFTFTDVEPNPALDDQVFRFTIPAGTDVVRP